MLAADQLRRRGRLARAGRYVLWASIACGPLALAAIVPMTNALGQPVAQAAVPAPTVVPEPTGYAEVFVDLWLRSSARSGTATDAVHSMAPGVDLPQPSDKTPMSVQRVAAVRSQSMGGRTWMVTVAATVRVAAPADADASAQPSQQPGALSQPSPSQGGRESQAADGLAVRYYAVPVSMVRGASSAGAPDALAVTSAPAQVSGPLALSGPDEANRPYGVQVQPGPLQQAVAEYLDAYLTGVGESSRYLSPGMKIPAAGAVYRKVELQTLSARTTVPANPVDGAVLEVLAHVRATDSAGQWPLAYPLQLKARAGRWEIAAVAPAGTAAAASASPSSSPASPAAPAPTASHEVN
ncbi:conjugal transfer protein [Kitasatospora sp. NPDC092948]|uniref:conjugal transfer protein n=1 Tax=Kitasatospora sp. NPDC092948 TaxID=3364088 RepID=UPI003828214F